MIDLTCPECGETTEVKVVHSCGATDLLPDQCPDCGADLGAAYDTGEWAYA